ncbi:MAG: type IV pili twitching motility protein PilT [Myxococcales bacterium]|nr:type IV pili twitching motility protein PilT [Myxococcales bacterium]
MDVRKLLHYAASYHASDIHVTAGAPPTMRAHGELTPLGDHRMAPEETEAMLTSMLTQAQLKALQEVGQVDCSFGVRGVGRFRLNGYRQRSSYAFAIRIIPTEVPSMKQLGLPTTLARLAEGEQGLVLVTGPTGSGKSTTLAAMIDHINSHHTRHILTLEHPIEYIHRHKRSLVNQREIGSDIHSFTEGLRGALRQDPDVILIGEMRDFETIQIALTAAETGHLVLATLHTRTAISSIERIVDVFPAAQQPQVRTQLASVLSGVVSQRLLQRRDGGGRIAAQEILIATPSIRNLIRTAKLHQVQSALQTGAEHGMQTMEAAVAALIRRGLVSAPDTTPQAAILNRRAG